MPVMSGQDLARELMRIRPGVPIVLTSGYLRPEEAEAARRIGIYDVVLKPNSLDDLARVLDAALASRRTS
jgi:CheY-like chemotaxis protein